MSLSRVSTMQGLLEVRLEVPQITVMLTMPQVHLSSHFLSYWTNKLCGGVDGNLLHGTALRTLSQQALDIGPLGKNRSSLISSFND